MYARRILQPLVPVSEVRLSQAQGGAERFTHWNNQEDDGKLEAACKSQFCYDLARNITYQSYFT
jgi:hypothetical protein